MNLPWAIQFPPTPLPSLSPTSYWPVADEARVRFKSLLSDVSCMAEPDWAKILDTMYGADGTLVHRATEEEDYEYEIYPPLGDNVELEHAEKQKELEYMEKAELIEEFADEGWIRPSELGVRVAHERELSKRQDRTNTTLVVFTLALVLASLVAVLPSTWSFLVYAIPLRLLGAFTVVLLVAVILWHTDLYEVLLS